MKGITTHFSNEANTMANDTSIIQDTATIITTASQNQSLSQSVRSSLQDYFMKLGGQSPTNLYDMVIPQVERPLIEMVLQHTGNNQSKTAKILGISRGTLRKKMAQYSLFNK